ncbi:MAG: hypothetical protein LBU91_04770 [Bacteroidales bacterium]|jgi:2-keto-4-pentenoate hydratase/2-oxohepta-3-ene-1,7-dioic acid hydratase in catechol pathway|nr:hypothetical protein [Bacteroidales bacterium]
MKIVFVDLNDQFRLIPDSALLLKNRPFFKPDYVQVLHAKVALVVKINRLGKYIQEKFAGNYYDEIGVAVNFYDKVALDVQIEKGFPWECATCFDGSFALSEFVKISQDVSTLSVNEMGTFSLSCVLHQISNIIARLSTYMTLKIGDYIAIEVVEYPTALQINDAVRLALNDIEMLHIAVK